MPGVTIKLPKACRATCVGAKRLETKTFEYETGILTTTPDVWSNERTSFCILFLYRVIVFIGGACVTTLHNPADKSALLIAQRFMFRGFTHYL